MVHIVPLTLNGQIQEGNTTGSSPWGVTVPNGADDTILVPATLLFSFVAQPFILQQSSRSSLAAKLTLEGVPGGGDTGLGVDNGMITIDTTKPEVDSGKGVEVTGDGNGIYANGDTVFVMVW